MGDEVEVLGRFTICWSFVFSGRLRRSVVEEWRREPAASRALALVDGAPNAVVGLLPGWLAR